MRILDLDAVHDHFIADRDTVSDPSKLFFSSVFDSEARSPPLWDSISRQSSVPTLTLGVLRTPARQPVANLLMVFSIHKRLPTYARESAFDPEH